MELEHSFTVPTDIETAWKTLLDIDRVALCMPGATLISHEGDAFRGEVKVKLGPVSMVYGGTATFAEQDATAHHIVIRASGSETKGTSTAQAVVHAQLIAKSPTQTLVEVKTDLAITGKPAQFGRGMLSDIASRIIGQFAENLAALVSTSAPGETTENADQNATATQNAPSKSGEPAQLNVVKVVAGPILKRAIPALFVIIALIWWLASR